MEKKCENSNKIVEDMIVFEESTRQLYQMYEMYINAGFDKDQAFELIEIMLTTKIEKEDANDG